MSDAAATRQVQENKNKGYRQKKKILKVFLSLLVLLAVGAGAYFWYMSRMPEQEESVKRNLSAGLLPGSNSVEMEAYADEMIRVQINSRPVFEDGSSEGNLYIGNPDTNNYEMEVEIVLDETGEILYNSGIIPPGFYIDNDKLDKVLDEGTYEATANITYYEEDGVMQSQTSATLSIVVGS